MLAAATLRQRRSALTASSTWATDGDDEVPPAVGDGDVGNHVEPFDRPTGGELLRRRHAELVTLLLARRPDRPRHTPVGDPVEQRFAFTFGQQLRVAHAVHAGVPGQHGGADHQRARPTPRGRPRRRRPPRRGRVPTSPVSSARVGAFFFDTTIGRFGIGRFGIDRSTACHHRNTSTGSPSASSPTRHQPSVRDAGRRATLGSTAARRPPEVCGSKHSASPPGVGAGVEMAREVVAVALVAAGAMAGVGDPPGARIALERGRCRRRRARPTARPSPTRARRGRTPSRR